MGYIINVCSKNKSGMLIFVKCIYYLFLLYIICKGNRGIVELNVLFEDYLMSG